MEIRLSMGRKAQLLDCPTDQLKVRVVGKCVITGKAYFVDMAREGYNAWRAGYLLQDVLSELTADQREFLISGMSPEAFNEMCKDGE